MRTTRRVLICGAALAAATGRVSRPARAQAPSSDVLALGALFPLSGPLAPLGDECFRGLDLAVDARNAAGGLLGKQIRLVKTDVPDAELAADAVRGLLADGPAGGPAGGHVEAIFGSGESAVALAATQASARAGIPYFELNAVSDAVTARGLASVFRFTAPTTAFAAVSVQAIVEVLAPLWRVEPSRIRLAVLHDDGAPAVALATMQDRMCREAGLRVVELVGYQAGTLDLTSVATRLRAVDADVVLHAGDSDDGLLFLRALRQIGWKPRMLIGCGAGYWLGAVARTAGTDLEGTMTIDVPPYRLAERIAPGAATIAASYRRKYGAAPRCGQSLVSLSGAQAFFDVIARAGTLQRDKLRAALLATDIPQGATPCGWGFRLDETGQNSRARPVLVQWQNGEQVTIYPSDAAVSAPMPALGA